MKNKLIILGGVVIFLVSIYIIKKPVNLGAPSQYFIQQSSSTLFSAQQFWVGTTASTTITGTSLNVGVTPSALSGVFGVDSNGAVTASSSAYFNGLLRAYNTTNNANVQNTRLDCDRASPADSDICYLSIYLSSVEGNQREAVRIQAKWLDADEATNLDSQVIFQVYGSGSLADRLVLGASTLAPTTNDGLTLGTGSLSWGDLFLASGGVISWANGNMTLTHSTNLLTFTNTQGIWSFAQDGIVNQTAFLDNSTGNEYAHNISCTVNKSVSGDGTCLQMLITDTASPGNLFAYNFSTVGTATSSLNNISNSATTTQKNIKESTSPGQGFCDVVEGSDGVTHYISYAGGAQIISTTKSCE